MLQSKIVMENKKSRENTSQFQVYVRSIWQRRSNITYFLRLQKGVCLVKLYIYTKNEFHRGLQEAF